MKKLLISGLALFLLGIVLVVVLRDAPTKTPQLTLNDGSWRWVSAQFNGAEIRPKLPDAFLLTFNNDSTFASTTDCNQLSGSYVVNGNNLTFNQIVSTKMYCENSQESTYASLLSETSTYKINDNELILQLKDDKGSMQFSNQDTSY